MMDIKRVASEAQAEAHSHRSPHNSSNHAQTTSGELSLPSADEIHDTVLCWRDVLEKDVMAFFFMGVLIALPTMVVTTGANVMFTGITGVYGICLSTTAAITSFSTPLFVHLLSYNLRIMICMVASILSFITCTLGNSEAGPAIGTVFAGFVYAFGTNTFLAVAAFYRQQTVITFSIGSGFSVVLGPLLYIAFMKAFHDNWKIVYLICLPFPFLIPIVWWAVMGKKGRENAELSRRLSNSKGGAICRTPVEVSPEAVSENASPQSSSPSSLTESNNIKGFGPNRTRFGLFYKVILPRYVLPLFFCTGGALFALLGLAPTYQELNSFKQAPKGDLNFQLNFFAYGAAQFLFSTISIFHAFPLIWGWTALQLIIVAIGIIQLFNPFLTYYGVWIVFIFFAGGLVGGGVTNTNYKIAEDFRRNGEGEDVRSFAMSYGGLGNFGGDAVGGVLAVVVQKLATRYLQKRT